MPSALLGVATLERRLLDLKQVASAKILRSAVRAGIKPAYTRAGETIPVGSEAHRTYKGRLVAPGFAKRNLRIVTRSTDNGTRVSAALGVRKEAFYAVNFVELGTSKSAAQPWLRPALSSTQDEAERAFAGVLEKRIAKATRA